MSASPIFDRSALAVLATTLCLGVFSSSASALEYPIGEPELVNGMEVAAVYLQPVVMEPAGDLAAAEAELERARTMALPGQPSPYFVNYEILDGEVATAGAVLGALDTFDHGPYRNLRVEVRVGDYGFDTGQSYALGGPIPRRSLTIVFASNNDERLLALHIGFNSLPHAHDLALWFDSC